MVADLRGPDGLEEHGLPRTYALDTDGAEVGHDRTRAVGQAVHDAGLRGVWCISAATADRSGRELAWFPARTASATRVVEPLPFALWRDAASIDDLA